MTPSSKTNKPVFDPAVFLAKVGKGRTIGNYRKNHVIFVQGDNADSIFYIQKGKIKLSVNSANGREAVVALLGDGEFFGEGCLGGQLKRMSTAATMTDSVIVQLEKSATVRVLHDEPAFSTMFLRHLLSRNIRIEEDLVDQL